MSIANEITRLQNAKSAIATAISRKGVSVPANTKLDGMAALIGNIPQGGSLETSTLNAASAVGGTLYYIDENGQGQSRENGDIVTSLRGSYFILDWAYASDGYYLTDCEIVRAYGPVETTVGDGDERYVIILKITGDYAIPMI